VHIQIRDNMGAIYIVGHKKRATLFFNITAAFLGGFSRFMYLWKRK